MLLALAAALTLLPAAPAAALPWLRGTPASRHVPPPPAPAGLQEVAPPLGVQQLKPLLEAHQPQVRIVSPQADSLVPAGPWTLQLELSDWPLLDAGPAGLGPHLVVQLDEAPPLRLTATRVEMPPLSPGSHRLSVVAAMPWGEAMRNPGAFAQIRLHQAAANPLAGPALGTPQLIPLLPVSAAADQPLLLDWILVDAPLQHLRDGDDSWRVRISLDGDALLLDHQEALWLRGLSPGRHPLVLELLDPRGEPLNPPFNSLVRELVTSPDDRSPPWLAGPLSAASLARLSGAAPPTAAAGGAEPQAERHHDQREPRAGSATTSATGSRGRASQQDQEGAEPLPSEAEAPTPPLIAAASSTGGTVRASSGISDTSPAALGSRAPNAPAVARTPADSGSPDRIQPPLPNAEQPEQATPPRPLAPAPRREPFTSPTNTDLSAEAGAPPQERQPDADAVATASAMAESDSGTNDNALRMQADADHDGNTPDADIADVENHDQENDAVDPVAPDRLVSPARDATPTKPPLTSPSTSKSRATQYSQAPQVAPPKERSSSAAQPFSEASALPVASPETAQPAESPRSVPPVQSPRRARSAESPASARPTPAPPPSAAAAPGSAPGEPGAAAADPPGLGPDALTIGPVLPRPGDLGEADRLISSRSVIGNVPTPSLSPRPSPPEPFDPWSSPLSVDPSARQGRDLSRSGDGKSPLERLRRWAGQ